MVGGVVEVQDSRRRLIMVVVGVCVSLRFVILFCSLGMFLVLVNTFMFFSRLDPVRRTAKMR